MTEQAKSKSGSTESDVQSVLKRLGTRAMGLTGLMSNASFERRQVARRQKRPIRYKDLEDAVRMQARFPTIYAGASLSRSGPCDRPSRPQARSDPRITIDMPDGGTAFWLSRGRK